MNKPIKLSQHAKERIKYRGCTEEEVAETINHNQWEKAELGRLQAKNNFPFNSIWNDKKYSTKQVKPIFIEEQNEIIVVSVYVYYF